MTNEEQIETMILEQTHPLKVAIANLVDTILMINKRLDKLENPEPERNEPVSATPNILMVVGILGCPLSQTMPLETCNECEWRKPTKLQVPICMHQDAVNWCDAEALHL